MKKETRKQEAIALIYEWVDQYIFDVAECGGKPYPFMKNREMFISFIYNQLVWGKAGQHFKFLTAEWINNAISEQIDKACYNWGYEI